jgi:hypothetical protein
MKIPGFNAEASLAKASKYYINAGAVFVNTRQTRESVMGQLLPVFGGAGSCYIHCRYGQGRDPWECLSQCVIWPTFPY